MELDFPLLVKGAASVLASVDFNMQSSILN